MSKLDLYYSRESYHNLKMQEKAYIDSPTKPVDSKSAKSCYHTTVWGFEPVEVSALKKTTNTFKVDDFSNEENGNTWPLVTLKK
ncbi:hypothetical protein H5410_040596 [Solanum commersonii]|uniref:Uncharacterized protein n=1 Tax=Solanum commersonii TaxID=4109 RepID=A0A9J5XQK9_SOLCO|nr:hypothetical protein H5410_040596 [Solanum commersonii]